MLDTCYAVHDYQQFLNVQNFRYKVYKYMNKRYENLFIFFGKKVVSFLVSILTSSTSIHILYVRSCIITNFLYFVSYILPLKWQMYKRYCRGGSLCMERQVLSLPYGQAKVKYEIMLHITLTLTYLLFFLFISGILPHSSKINQSK